MEPDKQPGSIPCGNNLWLKGFCGEGIYPPMGCETAPILLYLEFGGAARPIGDKSPRHRR